MPWLRDERLVPVGRRSGLERDWTWSREPLRPERGRWRQWPWGVGAISDVAVAVGLMLAAILIVLLAPFVEPARIGLGLVLVLFLPGYVLVAALYPRKDDLQLVERLALSLGLSVAVVPLIGLGLNYTPWGIRLNPILAFMTLFIVLAAAVATYRRLTLPANEAVGIPLNLALPKWPRLRMADRFLGLLLVLTLAGLGVGAYFLATSSTGSEEFTEFYVLGPEGKAEGYPRTVEVGDKFTLVLGVVNHEGEEASYRVQATIAGQHAMSLNSLHLANNEKWEKPLVLAATQPGSNLKVEFVLYKGDGGVPYRTLHLWLDVVGYPPELAGGAPLSSGNNAPASPTLNSPANGAVAGSTSPTLDVTVSDRDGDNLTVTFYGREATPPPAPAFTIVALPDTQKYVDQPYLTPIFGAQTQWAIDTKTTLNTVFVTHLGDIVEHEDKSDREWTYASTYMATLDDNGMPNNMALGNHDISPGGVAAKFDQYFPVSRYEGLDWYGGYLGKDPSDPVNRQNKNNYELFSVGSLDFIIIHLEYDIPDYSLNWAGKILKAYPNRRAIISTHAFLDTSGNRPKSPVDSPNDNSAAEVWEQLIRSNCSVFMLLSGHYSGEGRRTDLNDCGQPVHQVVQNYQSRANGGDGWLRYFTFKPSENKIYAYTFSPTRNGGLGEFETDADSQFVLDYDMLGVPSFQIIATNGVVPPGSNTTVIWSDLAPGTQYEWYVTVSDGTLTTTGPILTFRTQSTADSE